MKSVAGRWKISLERELNETEEIKEVFLRYWGMTHFYRCASGTGIDYFNVSEGYMYAMVLLSVIVLVSPLPLLAR